MFCLNLFLHFWLDLFAFYSKFKIRNLRKGKVENEQYRGFESTESEGTDSQKVRGAVRRRLFFFFFFF